MTGILEDARELSGLVADHLRSAAYHRLHHHIMAMRTSIQLAAKGHRLSSKRLLMYLRDMERDLETIEGVIYQAEQIADHHTPEIPGDK